MGVELAELITVWVLVIGGVIYALYDHHKYQDPTISRMRRWPDTWEKFERSDKEQELFEQIADEFVSDSHVTSGKADDIGKRKPVRLFRKNRRNQNSTVDTAEKHVITDDDRQCRLLLGHMELPAFKEEYRQHIFTTDNRGWGYEYNFAGIVRCPEKVADDSKIHIYERE